MQQYFLNINEFNGQTSVRLPYDFAKTGAPQTRVNSLSFGLPHTVKQTLITKSKPEVFLVASIISLLHRYSPQSYIPITLVDDQTPMGFTFSVAPSNEIETLLNTITRVLEEEKPPNQSTGSNVLLSIDAEGIERDSNSNTVHDLHFNFQLEASTNELTIKYCTDLFEAKTVQRMGLHITNLLKGLIEDKDKYVAILPMLDSLELDFLKEATQGSLSNGSYRPIHLKLEENTENSPNKIAVSAPDGSLTYRQLNTKANALAHYLLAQGVEANDRIVVHLESSADITLALWAIFKVGATYVPLNPDFPKDRINTIVEDLQPRWVFTHTKFSDSFNELRTLLLDTFDYGALPNDNPQVVVDKEQIAYIFYTSGTTGNPKGSKGSYGNLQHYYSVAMDRYAVDHNEIITSLASYSFSISLFELVLPIVAGGCLRITKRSELLDPTLFAELLTKVSLVHASPSLLKTLVAYLDEHPQLDLDFKDLRHLSSGGDTVPPDLQRKLIKHFPESEIYVIYGCSEIACMGCTYFVDPSKPVTKALVGKPFKNVAIRVVDQYGNQVPVGVVGEVLIGGAGVAQGYVNRDALTKEKFIQDDITPFYKTGDMGRLNEEGNLELLGRKDFQIQVRGMRMELGEVEYHLRQVIEIQDAAAVAISEEQGPILKAFFVCKSGKHITPSDLRELLKHKLPEYMIPQQFIKLSALPLNVNRKVDRKALMQFKQNEDASPAVALQSDTQLKLAKIWASVLGTNNIQPNDHFMELGGHSLLLVQVVLKTRKEFGVELSIEDVFEDPTIAGIESVLKQAEQAAPTEFTKLHQQPTEELFFQPCSDQQQQLWFLHQLDPKNAAYNIPFAFELSQQLNLDLLKQSLQILVDRHQTFRTIFGYEDNILVQKVKPGFQLPISDTYAPNDRPDSWTTDYITAFAKYSFDLQRGPLIKAEVLHVADTRYFLLNFHHIIVDQLTILKFKEELQLVYNTLLNKEILPPQPVDFQYTDYTNWVKSPNQLQEIKLKVDQWKDKLQGTPPLLELPTDYKRDIHSTAQKGKEIAVSCDPKLTQKLRDFCKKHKSSTFVATLAALNVFCAKLTGVYDVVVGCPFANRNELELQQIMGCLMNTLPIRLQFSPQDSFESVLEQARSESQWAQGRQEASFEQIVQAVQPERSAGFNPLFQISFIYQDPPMELEFEHAATTPVPLHNGFSKFDLTLWLWDAPDHLQGLLEYNSDLFSKATINRFWSIYMELLARLIDCPSTPLSEISSLSQAEQGLLNQSNDTDVEVVLETLPSMLAEQVTLSPHTEAIRIPSVQYSMNLEQLDQQSSQWAHWLIEQGVERQQRVGICVDRNQFMIPGLWAILKAGATYIPIDPAFPADRIAYMVQDAALSTVLTTEKYQDLFTKVAHPVNLDQLSNQTLTLPKTAPSVSIGPDSLAYIIYTSGSTGKPKGVQITHRSAANFLQSMAKKPGILSAQKLLAVTTISFDISLLELFMPVLFGGTVVLASRAQAQDPHQLAALIDQNEIDIMQATPTTWQLLKATDWPGRAGLKILCGGEALPFELKEFLVQNDHEVWNMYGPTETTVWSSVKHLTPNTPVTIGQPIANTQFMVLDKEDNPVSIGVKGELCIGGAGVTAGYLKRPELNQQRFVSLVENKFYRTGDEAFWNEQGDFEVTGRLDYQIKLRGYRIELGEIEHVLNQHDGVEQAVVTLHEDQGGNQKLIGYVQTSAAHSVEEIKTHAKQFLPDYMVPSLIITLKEFPQTPNKKVDRKALPLPEVKKISKLQPLSTEEEKMQLIWKRVLKLDHIDLHDNFFEIGGHSLLAVQLFQQIKKEFEVDLPLGQLFQAGTIAELTKQLHRHDETQCLVPIKPKGTRVPIYMIHAAGGNVLLYKDLAESMHEDQPVYGLQSPFLADPKSNAGDFKDLAAQYYQEIKANQPQGPYHLAGYCLGGAMAYEIACQMHLAGEQVGLVALFETYNIQCFDPAKRSKLKFIHKLESVWFHLLNVLILPGADRQRFIVDKWKTEKERLRNKWYKLISQADPSPQAIDFTEINDRKHEEYEPGKYPGDIVVYKGTSDFTSFNDEFYGWKELVEGEVIIHKLKLKPRGMLMIPFVNQLAADLDEKLEAFDRN